MATYRERVNRFGQPKNYTVVPGEKQPWTEVIDLERIKREKRRERKEKRVEALQVEAENEVDQAMEQLMEAISKDQLHFVNSIVTDNPEYLAEPLIRYVESTEMFDLLRGAGCEPTREDYTDGTKTCRNCIKKYTSIVV